MAGFLAGLLAAVFPHGVTAFILLICTLVTIWYYRLLKRNNTKKKLVYTNRVKRLIITNGALSLLMAAVLYGLGGQKGLWAACGLVLLCQEFFLLPSNIINSPIEKGINRHYINDAKKRLQDSRQLTIIGITGSYGKTSVKYFLNTLLQSRFNVLMTPASYNTPMGVVKTIRGSLKPSHEIFICEMGARLNEIGRASCRERV